jgi:hypothetical protein
MQLDTVRNRLLLLQAGKFCVKHNIVVRWTLSPITSAFLITQ